MRQAAADGHLAARGTYVQADGVTQPAPAPRFSATPGALRRPPARPGADTAEVARDWGVPSLGSSGSSGPDVSGPSGPDSSGPDSAAEQGE